jgi:hypothetical protein
VEGHRSRARRELEEIILSFINYVSSRGKLTVLVNRTAMKFTLKLLI